MRQRPQRQTRRTLREERRRRETVFPSDAQIQAAMKYAAKVDPRLVALMEGQSVESDTVTS